MSILDTFSRFLSIEPMHERVTLFESYPIPLEEQVLALRRARLRTARNWRVASIPEALGNPAIQRAVSLISNTTGSLSIQGFRNGALMDSQERSLRVITRPDPHLTPREAYRDMAYCLATRGETVLYIAHRDFDGMADALVLVPLLELTVEENPRNRLFPVYRWGDIEGTRFSAANPTGKFVHITYLKEPGELRGMGPLQMCGAAVSVTVEAQEWAANFYTTGYPDLWIKAAGPLGGGDDGQDADGLSEAQRLKAEWTSRTPNTPAVTGDDIEDIKQFDVNSQGAQMLEAREYQNGDAARMFGIPGSLLEYNVKGSSLTYQNVTEEYTKFVRACLSINYLEPIEQGLSDLLPRSTVARFYVDGLLRADIKTRFDVYESAVTKSGVMTVEEARKKEGLDPGNVEVAPVPFAPPSAIPMSLPLQVRSAPEKKDIRCPNMLDRVDPASGLPVKARCNRLMVRGFAGSGTFKCERCDHEWAIGA